MRLRFALAVLLCAGAFTPAFAQEADQSGVHVTVTPYVWAPTITGNVALGPVSVPTRVTPADFVDGLQVGGMGSVRVDVDRTFVYAEGIFVDYRNSHFRPFFGQGVTSKIRFGAIGIGIKRQLRISPHITLQVSPTIGIQHLRINALVAGDLLNTSGSGQWTSPAAGLEIELPIGKRVRLISKLDAAGLGIADTDYRSAALMIDFHFTKHLSLNGGYRVAKGKFENPNGLSLDLRGGGPVIGLSLRL
jgi:hypothetical protein